MVKREFWYMARAEDFGVLNILFVVALRSLFRIWADASFVAVCGQNLVRDTFCYRALAEVLDLDEDIHCCDNEFDGRWVDRRC